MKVLIKNAKIICPTSPFNGMIKDILVENGIISSIQDEVDPSTADRIIQFPNLHISIGWMDIFAQFHDPGAEHKENINTGASAAAAGGFTDLMLIPNTSPTLSAKAQVEYLIHAAKSTSIHIHPIAAITKDILGKHISEMYDMHQSGAVAFSDGTLPLQSAGILLKALQYVKAIDATIIQIPGDNSIHAHGLMNEGIESTRLGLPGIPTIAEEVMVSRDIELLRYTGSKLHITGISTRKSLELIEAARNEGLNISCSVAPYQLSFCDEDLREYDTNLKLYPPLRKKSDMQFLREAFAAGKIDCMASHHQPQHRDDKDCEFEYAQNGMIGIQTLFSVMMEFAKDLPQLIQVLTEHNRKIFGLQIPLLEPGAAACISLFDPNLTYTYTPEMNLSKSKNSAYFGKTFTGKPFGTIHKNIVTIHA